ncbi:S9 family peptidase [Termitidicoccus mucosus]|uniref:Peptidase n=1 Tax=Termitidicoccus mucosus TaxID=1184151 RepID=A0A178IMH3_9BACT|nr:peptidase [Opitutaceae bacterium TSB47]
MKRLPLLALLLLSLGAICPGGEALSTPPRLVPLWDFFRNPEKTNFQLSPDGRYVSWLQPWESRLNIYVQQVGSDQATRVTGATERDIRSYFWASPSRIAYLRDKGGDENFHLFAVDPDGTNDRELTPFPDARVQIVDDLSDLEDNHGEIIIETNQRKPEIFDAFRIDTKSGEMKLLAENPGNVTGWVTDHKGRIRVATTSDGATTSLLYRATESEPFKTVLTTSFRETLAPLFFTYDDQQLYASSNLGRDKQAIVRIDPATAKEVEVIFEHPQVDVSNLLASRKRKTVTGVAYEVTRLEYHFFNPDDPRAKLQTDLKRRLPGYDVSIASMSRDETKVLVRTSSDKSRGAYYFYDLVSGDFRKLVDVSPWLNEADMADMQSVHFKARDGLQLTGYLTVPRGVVQKKLPAIINPHGGPWARDSWGFDPEVQFLANRGYAVLQINFRSSTGFGRKFWEAGFKKWGREMQDDLTDGVNWLIAQGIADPKKIGIYGGSYGGYATLAGLAFTPEVYAAGVDYVGPSNLFTLLASLPPYWDPFRAMMYEQVGDPETDKDLVRAASPLFSADKIRAPLLVIQGANDPRVKKAEAEQIVAALKERGIDVPYIVKANEGHGFSNEENRIEVYTAMEAFFAKHLGGRSEQSTQPAKPE